MSFVVPSSVVQYKLREGIFLDEVGIVRVLDEVAFWEDLTFYCANSRYVKK